MSQSVISKNNFEYHVGDSFQTNRALFFAGRTTVDNRVIFTVPLDKPVGSDVSTVTLTFNEGTIIRLALPERLLTYSGRTVSIEFRAHSYFLNCNLSGAEITETDTICIVEIARSSQYAVAISFS